MENKHQVLLSDRLEKNYTDFTDEWLALTPFELIEKAEEICATQLVKEHLLYTMNQDKAEWFLRFQNPLEIVRDKWMEENGIGTVHDEDISHAVWTVIDCQDTESFYDLAPGADPTPDGDVPVTVREFIERHPNVAFDMMTPGGVVYLTPEKAKLLLSGQSVKGHPADPEYAMKVTADELLNQEVIHTNFSDDMWHMLSAEIGEMEQESLTMEQEVIMC